MLKLCREVLTSPLVDIGRVSRIGMPREIKFGIIDQVEFDPVVAIEISAYNR
jgi:hypothetical protein